MATMPIRYKASDLLEAALLLISVKLHRATHGITTSDIGDPFANSGAVFKCDVFEAAAYDWRWRSDCGGEIISYPHFSLDI